MSGPSRRKPGNLNGFRDLVQHANETGQDYFGYLRSDQWAETRQEVLWRYGHACWCCHATPRSLDVHHLHYSRLGEEDVQDLRPLCRSCHDEVHDAHRSGDDTLAEATFRLREKNLGRYSTQMDAAHFRRAVADMTDPEPIRNRWRGRKGGPKPQRAEPFYQKRLPDVVKQRIAPETRTSG